MDELCQRFPVLVQKIMTHVDNETLINFKEAGRNNATFLEKERFYWIRIIQRYNCLYGELWINGKMVSYNRHFGEPWRKVVRKTPIEIIKELAVAVHQFPQAMFKYLGRQTLSGESISPLDCILSHENEWHPLLVAATCGSVNLCNHIIQKVGTKDPRFLNQKLEVDETTPSVYVSENIGDLNAFNILLANSEDINWCQILGKYLMHPNLCIKLHIGRIPFHIAASKRHLDVCRFFMEKCVDENHMLTLLIMEQLIFIMGEQCTQLEYRSQ